MLNKVLVHEKIALISYWNVFQPNPFGKSVLLKESYEIM